MSREQEGPASAPDVMIEEAFRPLRDGQISLQRFGMIIAQEEKNDEEKCFFMDGLSAGSDVLPDFRDVPSGD
jgi:hypothetical protein